ncbi:MAG: TetR/AcrR family transcriptional regulator [Mycobacteriaceae bacterium]|nr:TetR/AcrR family transcriptional regulator [Mycobacteriaceae bacterium]
MTTAPSHGDAEGKSDTDSDAGKFRQRLLGALAESIADDGYPKTTVADIVRRARTSRRTFYEHFTSKEDCFVVLHTEANADMIRQIYGAVDGTASWQKQIRQAVEAWITAGESQPTLTLSWIRDVPAMGAASRRLQRDTMEAFIVMVQTLASSDALRAAGVGPVTRERAIMLLGGLRELTAITVENGGHMRDITEEAVDATMALLAPRG